MSPARIIAEARAALDHARDHPDDGAAREAWVLLEPLMDQKDATAEALAARALMALAEREGSIGGLKAALRHAEAAARQGAGHDDCLIRAEILTRLALKEESAWRARQAVRAARDCWKAGAEEARARRVLGRALMALAAIHRETAAAAKAREVLAPIADTDPEARLELARIEALAAEASGDRVAADRAAQMAHQAARGLADRPLPRARAQWLAGLATAHAAAGDPAGLQAAIDHYRGALAVLSVSAAPVDGMLITTYLVGALLNLARRTGDDAWGAQADAIIARAAADLPADAPAEAHRRLAALRKSRPAAG